MKEPKFTKGPWRIEEGVYYACIRTDAGVIADMRTVGNTVPNRDNAHLIAAAPELFEALDELANGYAGNRWDVGIAPRIAKARDALAKALGEDHAQK